MAVIEDVQHASGLMPGGGGGEGGGGYNEDRE